MTDRGKENPGIPKGPFWLLTGLIFFLSACAGKPPEQPAIEVTRAELQAYIASDVVSDDRGRFREIFCAVLADHGEELPDYRICEEALRNSHLILGETDIRNDTQLVIFDQMVPGSKVFAVVDADHWAIAVPVTRSHSIIGGTLVDRNDYPREAFMEALLRYIEEDLEDG